MALMPTATTEFALPLVSSFAGDGSEAEISPTCCMIFFFTAGRFEVPMQYRLALLAYASSFLPTLAAFEIPDPLTPDDYQLDADLPGGCVISTPSA